MIQKEFGLPGNISQLMASMSHREFLARLAWLDMDMREPNTTHYYLMQIAAEIRNFLLSFGKKSKGVTLDDFKLQFKLPQEADSGSDDEEKLAVEIVDEQAKTPSKYRLPVVGVDIDRRATQAHMAWAERVFSLEKKPAR